MDKNKMVVNTLTDQLITDGKNLLKELDKSPIRIDSALWLYFPEEGYWKLMLSFPNIEKKGPRAAYGKIQKTLAKIKEKHQLTLSDVTLAKSDESLFRLLKSAVHTGPGISDIRFSNNVINGQLIPDTYIYRLN